MRRYLLAFVAGSLTLAAFAIPADRGVAAGPVCDFESPTIVGTPLDDIIKGTSGDDVIVGLAGNDTIHGRGGDDRICGDEGDDVIDGGGHGDFLDGGVGNDEIRDSGFGALGGPGDDTITEVAQVYGGEGNDVIRGGHLGMEMTVYGEEGNDLLVGADVLGEFGDELYGGSGDDTIRGRAGPDWIRPGTGNDLVDGGRGGFLDAVVYAGHRWGMTVNLAEGVAEANLMDKAVAELEMDRLTNIDHVFATEHDDVLIGNSLFNALVGCGGDDKLYGRGGNDYLSGYSAHARTTCPGGDGDDFLNGGAGREDDCLFGDIFRKCESIYRG